MDLTLYTLLRTYTDKAIEQVQISSNGKSAYEIAVENGFQGTVQEWLRSLQGETPYIGENGNWFIGDQDTGVSSIPDLEDFYSKIDLIALSEEEILKICK